MTSLDLQWREFRPEDPTEYNYVLSSWLRSYAESGDEFRQVPRATYFAVYEPVVKQLLDRSTVAIAWDSELPGTVLGYLVLEGEDLLHYFHTKRRFRRMGVGRWMLRELAELPAAYTHQPSFAATKLIGSAWTYAPERRFGKKAA
jgi:GNAT superfamily N-acetyltransferase